LEHVHIIGDPIIAACKVLLQKEQAPHCGCLTTTITTTIIKNVSVEFMFSATSCTLTVYFYVSMGTHHVQFGQTQ